MNTKEMVIFSGLQASGKTTYYNSVFSGTHEIVSLDRSKTRKNEMENLLNHLASNHNIVVDNTNPTAATRRPYIELALSNGYRLIGIEFRIAVPLAVIRNAKREYPIPVVAILATSKRMVSLQRGEGFHQIRTVDSSGK